MVLKMCSKQVDTIRNGSINLSGYQYFRQTILFTMPT